MSSPNFPKQVVIGYTGEHAARAIEFDCTEEFEKWPDAEAKVMYVRPTEDKTIAMYPGSTSRDGNLVYWTPDAFATELEGTDGYCQVFFYGNREAEPGESEENDEEFIQPQYLGKSALVKVTVEPALMAPESDPTLESVEYVSLYRRMQVAARTLERISVSATEGEEPDAQVTSDSSGFQIDFVLPRGRGFTFEDFTSDELNLLRGEAGPKGDKGDTGATGPEGPQGPAGTIEFSDLTDEQLNAFLDRVGWMTDSEIDGVFESESLTPVSS